MSDLNKKSTLPSGLSSSAKITLTYIIVAGLWIFFSDSILAAFASDASEIKWISIYKGMFFVAITGALLFLLIKRSVSGRDELQRELMKSEEKYRSIVETFHEVVWTFDAEGRITFINSACKRQFGYSPDEIIGNNFLQYIAGEFRKRDVEIFQKLLIKGGELIDYDTKVIDKSGNLKDVLVNAVMVKQEGGRKAAVFGTILDITEKKKHEELIRASEEKYRNIVETTNEGIWITNKENKTTFVNRTLAKMLGYEIREMLGRLIFEFIELDGTADSRRRLLLNKQSNSSLLEFKFLKKNGGTIWTMMNVTPLFDREGMFEGSLAMLTDISKWKYAQDALKESENKYKTLFDTSPSSIRVFDLTGKLLFANRQTAVLHGYDNVTEMIGMSVFDLMKGENVNISKNSLQKIINEGFVNGEICFTRKDGSEFPADFHSTLLTDEIGSPVGIISVVNDISEMKRAQQEVMESRERLGGILDSAMDAIVTTDQNRKIVLFNKSAEKMFNCSVKEALGRDINMFVPQRLREVHNKHFISFSGKKATKASMTAGDNLTAVTLDGKEIPVETSVSKFEIGGLKYFTVILRDITERIKYENDLKDTNLKLRLLASHLQHIREEERLLISRDIHDQVGQELTALKMDMVMLSKELDREGNITDKKKVIEELRSMAELTDKSIKWMRNLSTELRPDVIDRLGLFEAVEWHCKEFEKRSGIICDSKFSGNDSELSKEHSIVFFRILQESLTNVLRHSGASKVEVSMSESEDMLTLVVKDNGKGITQDQLEGTSSLGIIGMKERAYMLGGSVEVCGNDGAGAVVKAAIPKINKAAYD